MDMPIRIKTSFFYFKLNVIAEIWLLHYTAPVEITEDYIVSSGHYTRVVTSAYI